MGLSRNDIVQMAVLLVGCFLVVLNQTLLSPALPVIMHEMNVGETTVQWLTSAYAMVEAVVIPMNAFLLGRFHVRKLFIGAFALFACGSCVASLAPTFDFLLLGRVLQACATGVAMPMVFTIMILIAPKERRGSIMGIIGVVISFAPAIGPPLSGVLVDAVGWRVLFMIVIAMSAIVILCALLFLENREGFERTSFDMPSVFLSSFGMVSLLYGLSTVTSSGTPLLSVLVMVVGVALLTCFVRRQGKLEVPMLRVETLRVRRFRNAMLVVCLMEAGLLAIEVVMPLYMENSLGCSPTQVGLAMMPAALVSAVFGVVAGRIFDKHGVRRIAVFGMIVLEISAVAFCLCGIHTALFLVAIIYMAETLGWQLADTPTTTWGINSLPNEILQHGNAVLSTLMQVGASFGTAAIVSLTAFGPTFASGQSAAAQTYMGYHIAFIGTAVLLGVVALIVFTAVKDEKNPAKK